MRWTRGGVAKGFELRRRASDAASPILLLLLLTVCCVLPASWAAAQQHKSGTFTPREETPEMYPAAPHRDDTFYFCTACHGFRIVAAQGMSRARWDESLTWMTERHNMPKLEGQDREKILDYLAAAFPERRAPAGRKNPFLPQ